MKNALWYSLLCMLISLSANPPSQLQNYINDNFALIDSYNPQETDQEGNTLLHLAAQHGNAPAIEKLIQIDKNLLTKRNENGKLPLDFAYENSHFYIVNLLKSYYPKKLSSEYVDAIPHEIKEILSAKTKLYKNEFLEITQNLLIEECNQMLIHTQEALEYNNNRYTLKTPQDTPEYTIDENKIVLNLEHENSKKKYPCLWLILHKQINVLQNVHTLANPIELKIIFSHFDQTLLDINYFASTKSTPDGSIKQLISIGSFYLLYYVMFHFEPYTIWPIFAHETQHTSQSKSKFFLDQVIYGVANAHDVQNREIDADYMIAVTSLTSHNTYINFTQDTIALLIYQYIRSNPDIKKIITTHNIQTILKSVHLIAEKIKDSDPYFTTRNLSFLPEIISHIITKASQSKIVSKQPELTLKELTQKITQYTIKNYERLVQQYALKEYRKSNDPHPSLNVRNRNILKGRIITELDLLKKHYRQPSIIITHHNAPLLYHTIKQNLPTGILTHESHPQSSLTDPYHDISILLEFEKQYAPINPMPTITKNHLTQKYELKFPEPFIIFALCAPKAHTVFSATFLQAVAQRQNAGPTPLDVYPEPKNAYTVFQTVYNLMSKHVRFIFKTNAIIAAQVAYIIPELAEKIHEPLTQKDLIHELKHYQPLISNISNVSILENIENSDIIINNLAYLIFATISHMPYYVKNKNQSKPEMPQIPESIEIKQLQLAEQLGYFTLVNKILLTTHKSSYDTSLLELLIKFELNKCIRNYIQNIRNIIIENYDIHNTIFHAIALPDLPLLQNLLDKNNENNERAKNINISSIENLTPLHLASLFGNQEATQILIEANASLHATTPSNITVLHTAALGGNEEIIRILKEKKANDAPDMNGKTSQDYVIMMQQDRDLYDVQQYIDLNDIQSFIDAISHLDIQAVTMFINYKDGILVNQEYTINERLKYKSYPLHAVCKIKSQDEIDKILAIIQTLLDHGANIDAQDSQGNTPILTALSARNNIKIIQYLLERGANFSIPSNNNLTYIDYIFRNIINDIPPYINLFKEHGAQFIERDNKGNTILHKKINQHNISHIEILLDHVPELLEENNNDNNTPLHLISSDEYSISTSLPIINNYLNNPSKSTDDKEKIKELFLTAKNTDEKTPYDLIQEIQKTNIHQDTRDIIQTTMQLLDIED